jgi:hypothetical protein
VVYIAPTIIIFIDPKTGNRYRNVNSVAANDRGIFRLELDAFHKQIQQHFATFSKSQP